MFSSEEQIDTLGVPKIAHLLEPAISTQGRYFKNGSTVASTLGDGLRVSLK
jgi:hypothetical protein